MKKFLALLSLLLIFSQTSYGIFVQSALLAVKNIVRTSSQKATPSQTQRTSLKEARRLLTTRFSELILLRNEIAAYRNERAEDVELDMYFINRDFKSILSRLSKQKKRL